MLKIWLVISIFLFTQTVTGQYFEGKIVYKLSCTSKVKDVPDEQMCAGTPARLDYFIKNGNYKFVPADSLDNQWMLYSNKENKIYTKLPDNDTVYWRLGTRVSDSILEIKTNQKAITVLGVPCDEIIFICRDQVHKFYYNSRFPVDVTLFKNHIYGGLYDFYKRSGSLVLKEILESEYSILESVATEIKPMAVRDNLFTVPVNSVIIENPY